MMIWEQNLPVGKLVVYNERPDIDYLEVKQVHGNIVKNVNHISNAETEADGLYCLNENFQAMAIKTADCLPIWVCGEKGVAILHAGWRGVASNIFSPENLEHLSPFHFVIGPAIDQENYEVQPDFVDHFPHLEQCFSHHNQKIFFDLKLAAEILIKQQYPAAKVELSLLDTFSTPELHSYRKDKTTSRNWNLWLPGPLPV